MLLYIIRHGEPDYENDCLTAQGREQANALAKRLAVNGLDEIYSSPMGRALQTAAPSCELLGIGPVVEEWMSEALAWNDLSVENENGLRTWAFSCQNTKLLKNGNPSRDDWYNHPAFARCVAAKAGYERIAQCSDTFLSKLGFVRKNGIYKIRLPNEKRVAAFCHQGFGLTWLSHLLSVPPLIFWAGFDMTHSGITILYFENNPNNYTSPRCLCHSDTSHLYKEDLPLDYNLGVKI